MSADKKQTQIHEFLETGSLFLFVAATFTADLSEYANQEII